MKWFKNLSRDNLLYGGLIITFIILYGATAFVSWYHAIDLFLIGNAIMLSIILSFVAEVGQASALFSILLTKNKHKFLTWSVMIILTTLQVIGNVYATYDYINKNGGKGVAEFAASILKPFGLADMDPETFKVIIAWILGALLPIIALSMTALVAQNMILRAEEAKTKFDDENSLEPVDAKDIISEVSKIRITQEELEELEGILTKKEPIGKPPVEEVEINKNDVLGRTEGEINLYDLWVKEQKRKNRPDTSDEIHEEWNKMYDEINKEQEQESDDMDEDTASLTPDIQEEEDPIGELDEPEWDEINSPNEISPVPEIIVTNTNGLVEGMTGNMGIGDLPSVLSLSGSSEISPEAQKAQEEEHLERLRAIARENLKKK